MRFLSPSRADAALVFLFDRNHMVGFKTLVYSLKKTRSFIGLPKICITNDETVAQDEFVRRECAHIELMSPKTIERYSDIKNDAVVRKYKLDWIATYHFLKFNVFKETRYQKLIYIDCDTVALKNLDHMLTDAEGVDFMACRGLGKERLRRPGSHKYADYEHCEKEVNKYLDNLLSGRAQQKFDADRSTLAVNSGVMVIDRSILGQDTVDWMIQRASERAYRFEQQVVRDFIIEHPHIKFRYLSPYVNFSRTALDSTHPSFWDKHSDHVELLHFVGPAPWREGAEGYVDDIWKEIYQESLTQPTRSVASRILGTLKARLPT